MSKLQKELDKERRGVVTTSVSHDVKNFHEPADTKTRGFRRLPIQLYKSSPRDTVSMRPFFRKTTTKREKHSWISHTILVVFAIQVNFQRQLLFPSELFN